MSRTHHVLISLYDGRSSGHLLITWSWPIVRVLLMTYTCTLLLRIFAYLIGVCVSSCVSVYFRLFPCVPSMSRFWDSFRFCMASDWCNRSWLPLLSRTRIHARWYLLIDPNNWDPRPFTHAPSPSSCSRSHRVFTLAERDVKRYQLLWQEAENPTRMKPDFRYLTFLVLSFTLAQTIQGKF